ncbi:MAG: GNAT family N-acetyltransferase [Gammaproteobacteria bacterium]|jgi:aminoglycoside 6'-N-acetyltransferase|nr:GNAT family N-acetyltransferase [Gammaproteobacteria bacterium]
MIIFLNGAPSSGKSVIARELMRQSERPFLYYSIDHLVNFWIDEKFVAFEDEPKSWFFHQHILDTEEIPGATVEGPHANQLHWDMIDALKVFIQKGYDLIIDEVLWKRDIFQRYTNALCQADKVYLVKIICDLIECERRESLRKDRYIGLARELYEKVYVEPPGYDLEIDTTAISPQISAKQILQFVEKNEKPQAFLDTIRQDLSFKPLLPEYYHLMQKWINTPHVATWWGEGKTWSFEDIESKYDSYVHGFKEINGKKRPIKGYVIFCDNIPIGYIQYYDAYHFPRDGYQLLNLPPSLASIDLFIGEPEYLGKGLGVALLKQFITQFVWQHFDNCFVDADANNAQAIHTYIKAGFSIHKELSSTKIICLLRKK